MYFDTHVHLAHTKFDKDVDFVIKTAYPVLSGMIEVSYSPEMWPISRDIAMSSRNIYLAAGIHPHDADRYRNFSFINLENFAVSSRICAVGETGLDYYRDYARPDNQRRIFISQIELAAKLSLPLIFHIRNAFDDFFSVVRNSKCRGVVHSFSGSLEDAKQALDLGFYIGLNCIFMYVQDKEAFSEIISYIPLDRLLLETDSPFLPPMNMRSKRNIPQNISFVGEYVSGIKNIQLPAMQSRIMQNVRDLFKININDGRT